jgi:hypothetical protein
MPAVAIASGAQLCAQTFRTAANKDINNFLFAIAPPRVLSGKAS